MNTRSSRLRIRKQLIQETYRALKNYQRLVLELQSKTEVQVLTEADQLDNILALIDRFSRAFKGTLFRKQR
jgi:hypothetical protein